MNHGAELAIVAEPTLLDVVYCHKGVLRWKIRTSGRRLPQLDARSWARTPSTGWRQVLEALERYAGGRETAKRRTRSLGPAHPVGRPDRGGQSVNVVPDWCEIEVDRRLVPGEDAAEALHEASAWLKAQLPEATTFQFSEPGVRMPPLEGAAGDWLEPLMAAIEVATGRRPVLRGVPFGTDAGPLSAAGTPLRRLRPRRYCPGAYQGRMG